MNFGAKSLYYTNKMVDKSGIINLSPRFFHDAGVNASKVFERSNIIKKAVHDILYFEDPILEMELWGQRYKNPLGLAAGFLKEADGLTFWEQFGFGYLVIGGITLNPQPGNPDTNLFRYSGELSIINNMGFPSSGVDNIVRKLEKRLWNGLKPNVPIWANLANNVGNSTNYEKAMEFKRMMAKLYPHVDVFELSISCPNQEGVCDLQSGKNLKVILEEVQKGNERLALLYGMDKKTIVIKISPLTAFEGKPGNKKDLTLEQLEAIVDACIKYGADGITATNTAKEHYVSPDRVGGESGKNLHLRALETVEELRKMTSGSAIKIIGVGGIGAEDSIKRIGQTGVNMMESGADALQMLTGFVMGGTVVSPKIIKEALVEYYKNKGKN